MKIPQNLDTLKNHPKNDISLIATELGYPPTHQTKAIAQGDCPFGHGSEGKQCFTAYSKTRSWFCFNCRQGGDVVKLVRSIKKFSFPQTIKFLCERAGLNAADFLIAATEDLTKYDEQNRIEAIIDDAASFYLEIALKESWFLGLMKNRYGLAEDTIRKYRIGYSNGSGLFEHLSSRGHTMAEILSAGLFYKPQVGGPSEVMATRIIFPNIVNGRAIYLTGRQSHFTPLPKDPGKRVSKYKKQPTGDGTMPEISHPCIDGTSTFNEDTILASEEIVSAEGVTDCLALAQIGIPSISPVTTRYSSKQTERLISKLNGKRFMVVGDSEPNGAGEAGALDIAKVMFEAGIDVLVAKIPPAETQSEKPEVPVAFAFPQGKRDLNDVVREGGREEWEKVRATAVTYPQAILKPKLEALPRDFRDKDFIKAFDEFWNLKADRLSDLVEWALKKTCVEGKKATALEKKIKKHIEEKISEDRAKQMAKHVREGHEGGILLNSSRMRSDVHREVAAKMRSASTLFSHGDVLVRIDKEKYLSVTDSATVQTIFASDVAECFIFFIDDEGKPKYEYHDLPAVFAQSAFKSVGLFGLKEIYHYAKFPILNGEYEVIPPGYDKNTCVYYGGESIEPRDNIETIQEIFYQYPWADDNCASYENWLALLVTQPVKHLFLGESPSGLVMGNQPDLGKTSLTHACSLIYDGKSAGVIRFSDEEEMAKNIVTQLLIGTNFLTVDNLKEENVSSPTLEMLMTSPVINLRILGGNKSVNRPNTLQTFLTLNDGNVCRDILSRSVPVRLHVEGDTKALKWGNATLADSILPRRKIILGEILGMWKRWAAAGKPLSNKNHRFRKWARVVGGVMEANGYTNFLENLNSVDEERDPLFLGYLALVDIMQSGSSYQATALANLCMNKNIWREQLSSNTPKGPAIKLGRLLERLIGRSVHSVNHKGEMCITAVVDTSTNSKTYHVVRAVKQEMAGGA